MKRTLVWWFGVMAIVGGGCGSSGSTAACTQGTGTSRTCLEYSVNGGGSSADALAQIKSACTQSGGAASDSCSHVGADGGCRQTTAQGTVSVSITSWTYAGDVASEMANCTSSGGGIWIAP